MYSLGRIGIVTFASAAIFGGGTHAGHAQEMTKYDLVGTNANGSRYTGIVQMMQDGPGTFRVRWMVNNGTVEGVGIKTGNILSAAYLEGGKITVCHYVIDQNGLMQGRWTLQGTRATGTEVLTPSK